MYQVSREEFERIVQEAVEALPEALRERMNNVVIVVKDHPTPSDLNSVRGKRVPGLYGLYRGVPLTVRGAYYDKVLPDLITIFQQTHEAECENLEALEAQVRVTVRHEIAHHFGISDERLEELGAY